MKGKKQGMPELPFQGRRDLGYKCETCGGTGFRESGWMNRGPTAGWCQCKNICHACAGSGSVDAKYDPARSVLPPYEHDVALLAPSNARVRHSTRGRWVTFQCASDKPGGIPDFFDDAEHKASLERNGVDPEDLVWQAYQLHARRWASSWRTSEFPAVLRHAMFKAQAASDILVRICEKRIRIASAVAFVLPDPEPEPAVLRPVFADEAIELEAWL